MAQPANTNAAVTSSPDNMVVKDLRLPIEVYPDGKVKTQITAVKARMLTTGNIEAEEVKVEFFDPLGNQDGKVSTGSCFYNKEKGRIESKADVCVDKRGGLQLKGKGFDFDADEQLVRIHSAVCLTFTGTMNKRTLKK